MARWASLIELPDGCGAAVREVLSDVDGEELMACIPKTLQKTLRRAGAGEPELAAAAVLRQRDEAAPRAAADSAEQQADDMINVLMMKEREANQKLMDNRAKALKARDEGFPIPVRRVGDIDWQ